MEGQRQKGSNKSGAPPAPVAASGGIANTNNNAPSSSAPPLISQRIPRRTISGAPGAAVSIPTITTADVTVTTAIAPPARPAVTNYATTKTNPAAAANAAPARVVPRPPLNLYLKVAIVRDGNDAVVCEDPEHPGKTKTIVMNQLLANSADVKKERGQKRSSSDAKKQSKKKKKESNNSNSNSNNKKEIPVPTITTVKRYDTDIPPNYAISQSYVRNICPTYKEVLDETIDYNLDAEDERWWRMNADFGPFSKARIIITGEEDELALESESKNSNPSDIGAAATGEYGKAKTAAADAATEREVVANNNNKDKGRNKKGKFVKKGSSKKIIDDMEEVDAMEVDEFNTPSHTYTIQQVLLLNPKYLHSRHSTRYLLQKYNPKLPLSLLEQMMDILEKATGFEFIMSNQQAEEILVTKMPELVDIFGHLSAKERRLEEEDDERYLTRWLKSDAVDVKSSPSKQQNKLPTLAQPITLPAVIHQVYNYWMAKRSKLRKPLLRRYWPPTAATDTNPHQVFRQPSKEKRRLRKKKQNDLEAYKKMKQLKLDFERVKILCELILQRENVNSTLVELTNDYFEERMNGWIDTSGGSAPPRQTSKQMLNKRMIESIVLNVPKYFEDGPIVKVKGGKKRKRSQQLGGWNVDSRDPSPVPHAHQHHGAAFPGSGHPSNTNAAAAIMANLPHGTSKPPPTMMAAAAAMPPPPRNIVIAGHDGGFPVPNFLQPLASRESHPITTWEDAVPSIPSYVNGKATTQTNKFRHRPRLGRGGRIVIDRVPCPSFSSSYIPSSPPPTVITYGSGMERSGYDIAILGADGPNYSIPSSPDDKLLLDTPNKNTSEGGGTIGGGTNAKSAPKASPAQCLLDLLPKPLGKNPTLLSSRIEEICALGLMEDYQKNASTSTTAATTTAAASSAVSTLSSSKGGGSSSVAAALEEEMDEILVPIEDWMEAPEGLKVYGVEKFVIGPL
mmetsp:Transcript_8761/g.15936  ORF Transcript_8761/g.15936 Transcript_8761/m.15936 type:complete len:960 (+) Transcript_8761:72-2951(+)